MFWENVCSCESVGYEVTGVGLGRGKSVQRIGLGERGGNANGLVSVEEFIGVPGTKFDELKEQRRVVVGGIIGRDIDVDEVSWFSRHIEGDGENGLVLGWGVG